MLTRIKRGASGDQHDVLPGVTRKALVRFLPSPSRETCPSRKPVVLDNVAFVLPCGQGWIVDRDDIR